MQLQGKKGLKKQHTEYKLLLLGDFTAGHENVFAGKKTITLSTGM